MTTTVPLPNGFEVGHWTDADARTGCTVILAPDGTRGGVDVRGGGTGTREIEGLQPLANAEGPTAVLLTGGSAFGLGAADGVMRWLRERGRGRPTPFGLIPLVSTAVVFDLAEGEQRWPTADDGYGACAAAGPGIPARGRVGAGAGAAVGKMLGRERGTESGVGYAATRLPAGETVAAIVVANAFGDVLAQNGDVLGGPRGGDGSTQRSTALMASERDPLAGRVRAQENTTLAAICTDASLDKRGCGIVARMAAAGIARAVDPTFTPLDGDVVFCLASGAEPPLAPGMEATGSLTVLGAVAATMLAEAIRDAVRQANPARAR
jgi:L-aminopeptidase/D-esterase-like protein